jgi:hypothetical protein
LIKNESEIEILVFYGALFFTCVIGIIELLPELDKWLDYSEWMGILYQIALSLLYFGLLLGAILSMYLFLRFQELKKVSSSIIIRLFLGGKKKWIFVGLIFFIFYSIYLIKGGLDQMKILFIIFFIVIDIIILKKVQSAK